MTQPETIVVDSAFWATDVQEVNTVAEKYQTILQLLPKDQQKALAEVIEWIVEEKRSWDAFHNSGEDQ